MDEELRLGFHRLDIRVSKPPEAANAENPCVPEAKYG